MEQASIIVSRREDSFGEWTLQDLEDLESQRETLAREKRELEQEKREFRFKREMEKRQQEQERRLFEMKWKVLEGELLKMAEERRDLEQKKSYYYERLREQEGEQQDDETSKDTARDGSDEEVRLAAPVRGGIFFKGVGNELALKKRYKDLLKIFHPDNLGGDTYTLQIINREYDRLKQAFGSI